jgi:hypothetical protein
VKGDLRYSLKVRRRHTNIDHEFDALRFKRSRRPDPRWNTAYRCQQLFHPWNLIGRGVHMNGLRTLKALPPELLQKDLWVITHAVKNRKGVKAGKLMFEDDLTEGIHVLGTGLNLEEELVADIRPAAHDVNGWRTTSTSVKRRGRESIPTLDTHDPPKERDRARAKKLDLGAIPDLRVARSTDSIN